MGHRIKSAYEISNGKKVKWVKGGKGFRLASEAEWEFAAKGGIKSKGYIYSGSNKLEDVGWYKKNSNNQLHPVGELRANELEIYDMSGNVREWCWDEFNCYSNCNKIIPASTNTGFRIEHGGCYGSTRYECAVGHRAIGFTNDWYCNVGFRIAINSI